MHPLLIFVTRGVSLGGGCRRTGGNAHFCAICAGHFQRPGEGGGPPLFFAFIFFRLLTFVINEPLCILFILRAFPMPCT